MAEIIFYIQLDQFSQVCLSDCKLSSRQIDNYTDKIHRRERFYPTKDLFVHPVQRFTQLCHSKALSGFLFTWYSTRTTGSKWESLQSERKYNLDSYDQKKNSPTEKWLCFSYRQLLNVGFPITVNLLSKDTASNKNMTNCIKTVIKDFGILITNEIMVIIEIQRK